MVYKQILNKCKDWSDWRPELRASCSGLTLKIKSAVCEPTQKYLCRFWRGPVQQLDHWTNEQGSLISHVRRPDWRTKFLCSGTSLPVGDQFQHLIHGFDRLDWLDARSGIHQCYCLGGEGGGGGGGKGRGLFAWGAVPRRCPKPTNRNARMPNFTTVWLVGVEISSL